MALNHTDQIKPTLLNVPILNEKRVNGEKRSFNNKDEGCTFKMSFSLLLLQLNHYLVITQKASGLGTKVWW